MAVLYVVATPIGNLQDITERAVATLRKVDLIAAEDTRVTMKLLQVFDIHTPMTSCHRHNELGKGELLAEKMLSEDLQVALTTDAGTPGISDPGYGLVRAALARGIQVIPVPGCCAAIAALSVCGFDTREFAFYGFPPREKKEILQRLKEICRGPKIAVLHESPYRVQDLIAILAEALPGVRLSVSCDLTKLHELTLHGTAQEVLDVMRANPKTERGEYCLVLDLHGVECAEEAQKETQISLEARLLEELLAGKNLREAQETLFSAGEKRNAVKAAALNLKRMLREE